MFRTIRRWLLLRRLRGQLERGETLDGFEVLAALVDHMRMIADRFAKDGRWGALDDVNAIGASYNRLIAVALSKGDEDGLRDAYRSTLDAVWAVYRREYPADR